MAESGEPTGMGPDVSDRGRQIVRYRETDEAVIIQRAVAAGIDIL